MSEYGCQLIQYHLKLCNINVCNSLCVNVFTVDLLLYDTISPITDFEITLAGILPPSIVVSRPIIVPDSATHGRVFHRCHLWYSLYKIDLFLLEIVQKMW